MALENLTKITSVGISSHIALTGVTTVGFITSADAWVGGALTVGGNITIGGTVTYEDVTNIDSVGIITSQNGLRVTAGGINVTAGVSTYSGLVDVNNRIDVVGGANIDQANITGILTATTLIGALTTTDACQTGDLTIVNGNPDLRLKDSNHAGNNTEHIIAFQDSSGNNQMNIGSPFGEQHLRIKHGTTELVKIQTNGRVGINTTSIDHVLQTQGSGNNGSVRIENSHTTLTVSGNTASSSFPHNLVLSNYQGSGNADNRMASIGFDIPTTSSHANATIAYQATNSSGNGDLQFWLEDDNTSKERLRITSDGHIGIGSDAPSIELDILNTSSSADLRLKTTANSFNSFIFDSNRSGANDNLSIIDGRWNGNIVSRIQFLTGSDTTNKDDGYMAFHTRQSGQSLEERLRITSAGLVGIGTANPTQELSLHAEDFCGIVIKSDRTTSTSQIGGIQFQNQAVGVATAVMNSLVDGSILFKTAGEESVRITGIGGSVGIGTNAPVAQLHLQSSAGGEIVLSDSDAVRKNGIRCASSDNICIYADANSEGGSSFIKFEVDGSDRGRFDSNGNLRIEDGDLQINTAGHGIDFSATSDGGTLGSELLDDYEEGTYTPLMYGHSTGTGSDTISGNGYYTKVGNVVTTTLVFSNKNGNDLPSGGSEQLRISGLPFNAHASAGNQNTANIFTYNVNFDPAQSQVFICAGSHNYLRGYRNRDTATWQPWYATDWRQSQIYLYLTITYLSTV